MTDCKDEIASIVQDAYHSKAPLHIKGGDTKAFYGNKIQAETLSLRHHTGIIEYEPSELYLTARSGTCLHEIEKAISEQNQMFPCEPPHFGPTATLGGMVASGLAGPRRAATGSVRDCILGTEILNGKGQSLSFGGRVMKNVAGYDVSRLMCGALGTLGVITSVTIRLLPMPAYEQTIVLNMNASEAVSQMNQWANTPMPITATFHHNGQLYVRLSGSSSAVQACMKQIGGDELEKSESFWVSVKEQSHDYFNLQQPLWKISVPPCTEPLNIEGNCAIEWNGALRWYATTADENTIRTEAKRVGGHACLFKGNVTKQVFHLLPGAMMKIHKKLKHLMDPAGILNPGKMFADF